MDHFLGLRLFHPPFLSKITEITSKSIFELIILHTYIWIYNHTYIHKHIIHTHIYAHICVHIWNFFKSLNKEWRNFSHIGRMTEAERLPGSVTRSSHSGAQVPQEDENRAASAPDKETKMWFEMRLQSSILYPGVAAIPGLTTEKENRTCNHDGQDSGTQVILSRASEHPELLTQDPVSG